MKEYFTEHRRRAAAEMEDNSLLIVYAGIPLHANEDDYCPFEVNSQYFWLTGLQRAGQALIMSKRGETVSEYLFIEESNPLTERWNGKMLTKTDAAAVSGISEEHVLYTCEIGDILRRLTWRGDPETVYFDTFRYTPEDMDDYNLVMAKRFAEKYPAVRLKNLHSLIAPLRTVKDAGEIAAVRTAIGITRNALEEVLRRLRPGMKEYQVQAVFEGSCLYQGTKKLSFPTIAGSGINACSMHYDTNEATVNDGDLILLDLGAKYNNYCSDITRTYPANGRFSDRQKQIYALVLKANRAVAAAAKPGMTLRSLNDLTRRVLGEGLVELGILESSDDIGRYYMHSVSHTIGIDTHDALTGDAVLQPGWIISDEPGLYIDEESIGIRIEDDLLITENGCECLSESVIRGIDEIEAFMAAENRA